MKRKVNPKMASWVAHLKKWAKDHKMKYSEAMKDPRARSAWKK
jgi:hypothetical protein